MRFPVLFAAAALLFTTLAAHADTMTENISISNVVTTQDRSRQYGANTNFFPQFNLSSGTLNSITLSLTGTATDTSSSTDEFNYVLPASAPLQVLTFSTQGRSFTAGSFSFAASGTDSSSFDLAFFEGTGTQALRLDFLEPTTVNSASGTLTYNYTPTVVPPMAVTPEPSSILLLGTGLLGALGVARKRFA